MTKHVVAEMVANTGCASAVGDVLEGRLAMAERKMTEIVNGSWSHSMRHDAIRSRDAIRALRNA